MKPLSRMHLALLALVMINILPAVEAEDSWGVFAIAFASAVLSCIWFRFSRKAPAPKPVIILGVTAATVYLIYEMFYQDQEQTVHIIDLAHFIIFLGCCKFFDFQNYRDAGLLAMISFLLMVISAFVTASPLFAMAAIIDITFGLSWLLHFHTRREADAVNRRQALALSRALGRLPDRLPAETAPQHPELIEQPAEFRGVGIKRAVALSSAFIALSAACLFIVVPRGWRGGIFSRMHGLVPASVTGFSDAVELHNNLITEDETTVMRARFFIGSEPITDVDFQPYLRGLTFDRYFRGKWQRTPSVYPRVLAEATRDAPLPIIELRRDADMSRLIRQEIWLESLGSGVLFGIYPPLVFGSDDVGRIRVDRKDLVIEANSSSRKAAYYTIWSSDEPIFRLLNTTLRRPQSPRDGQSTIPRRVEELARTFVPSGVDTNDPQTHESIARAIRDYLSEKPFEYTLDRRDATRSAEPIIDFLFETRRGHCEYFASAMTLMCQALGMQARLVTGYHGGELNEVGGFYQFRRRDAHAWVEVWLPEQSWTAFDPTPPSTDGARRDRTTLWADINRFLEFLEFKWSTTIVSFDERSRAELADGIAAWLDALLHGHDGNRSVADLFAGLLWGPEFLAVWQRTLYWLLLLLCIALIVVALRVLWIVSLMLREYLPKGKLRPRAIIRKADARFYDRLIVLLENKGHVKPATATPREFAERLSRSNHDLAMVPEIVDWFYEVQYGGHTLGRSRLERVREFLRRLREDPSFGAA
ncbi:MAG: DUF3488 domain-containing protein [Phycisphaerae bacterium]|nr:DUF3488 domain-containing protein [Phycisphaerae bacterium]